MPLIVKPKWFLSNDWVFFEEGKNVVARIVIPWSYYLVNYGRVALSLVESGSGTSSYEMTFPRRSAGYLGNKEIPIRLLSDDGKEVAVLKHLLDLSTEETLTTWKDRNFNCKLSAIGQWEITEANKQIGTIKSPLSTRTRTLSFFDENLPIYIQALIFWGTVRVKLTKISV